MGPAQTMCTGMRLKQKRRHHAEVAAATADRPEQVGIFVRAGDHETSIGEHDIGCQQIVDGQAVLAA